MSIQQDRQIEFSQPLRQILFMVVALALVGAGTFALYKPIAAVFNANPYLNGFIGGVFIIGVFACFWTVTTLISAVSWIEGFAIDRPGHEFVDPPRILISLAALLRDRRSRKALTAATSRSILDTVATRLDEMRDITRYIANLLILTGLLGTFWGLSQVVPGIVETMRSLNTGDGQGSMDVFNNLMAGLNSQLDGMGTAFASSLLGLAGSLVVGLLDLFGGHAQNRFYRELEEWLSSISKISLASEAGEGGAGSGIALEMLDRGSEQIERLTELMAQAEERRVETDAKLHALTHSVELLASRIEDGRASQAENGSLQHRDDAEMIKRLDAVAMATEKTAQILMAQSESTETAATGGEHEARLRLRNIDAQLTHIAEELATGRQDMLADLRMDIARLTATISGEK